MTNRIDTMNTWKLNLIYSIRFQNLDLGVGSDRIIPRLDGAYNSFSDISGNTIVFSLQS